MKKPRFIDIPAPADRNAYERAIERIIENNRKTEGLRTIYRLGNITTPGISDIDILFVFENGCRCTINGLEDLPRDERRLFTHGIMAMPEKFLSQNNYYTIWSRHDVIWGKHYGAGQVRNSEEEKSLGVQTAMEFFLANYIDLEIQEAYGIFKLRALLQHMKGLLYDLELIGQEDAVIKAPLLELKEMIRIWFDEPDSIRKISIWLQTFLPMFRDYLKGLFMKQALYFPSMEQYRIANNITLINGNSLKSQRQGWLLPAGLGVLGRKYFKIQHRMNRFIITCPITHQSAPITAQRFDFLREMKAYNRTHLPNFMTMTTSITAKII